MRISSASLPYAIVVYGRSQSPSTPSRSKSAFWRAICSVAYARESRCVFSAGRLRPCCFSICTSIGMPWQSHPGTYGASKPASDFDFTTMSLRILLTAWPMWMSPFAYGGPSCSTKRGRPCAAARSRR